MGIQEFPAKPVNKGGIVIGTINGPTEVEIGAQDSYLVADSTSTPGARWQTYRQYYGVQLTSGTSWTVPATVGTIDVIVIGGGQGGDGASTAATANTGANGNGGSAGAIVFVRNYPVTPGAAIAYSIGAGSAGGANPGAVASITNNGASAGNTTFGSIVAPGGANKVGTYNAWASLNRRVRGCFDIAPGGTTFSSVAGSASANNYHELAGLPQSLETIAFYGKPTTATAAFDSAYPYALTVQATGVYASATRREGLSTTFSKLLSLFTAPIGGTATQELTAGTKFDGWAGIGGSGSHTASPSVNEVTYHGAGQGATIDATPTGVNKSYNGGAAAANTGAGGGGCAARTASTTPVGAAGGAGGSGTIFIGYWA